MRVSREWIQSRYVWLDGFLVQSIRYLFKEIKLAEITLVKCLLHWLTLSKGVRNILLQTFGDDLNTNFYLCFATILFKIWNLVSFTSL